MTTINEWRRRIQTCGILSLASKEKNQVYSQSLKLTVVQAYLNKEGSLEELALKFGLRSKSQLRGWILKYNQGELLNSSRGGSTRAMVKSRKTSYEERLEIARYCEAHDNNYQETAELYDVSYSQVYLWARKYAQGGETALLDRRGKAKEEVTLTDMDRLRLENRKLQNANRKLEVENALLKKLEELERRSR